MAVISLPLDAAEILDREFLEVRARLLQVAATLDRLDRADGDVTSDPRHAKLRQAIGVLAAPAPARAEQLQLLFSLSYEKNWKRTFGLQEESGH